MDSLAFLRLLQFADSALPIGAAAHSFGVESLVAEGALSVENLPPFLDGYLEETGALEASFCRRAWDCDDAAGWLRLNQEFSAWRPARESRSASLMLGRRLLRLADLHDSEGHLCTAFGYVGRLLGAERDITALAYLHQSITAMLSACQRLLPLGQARASRLLWNIKPKLIDCLERECASFTPALDIASMRHPSLETRLFIS